MRTDPALRTVSGCSPETDQPLASPSTLCRLENRIDRATLGKVHGNQEKRFFHGYYKSYCFLPWYVFRGDQLLCADPRPSNIDAAKHSRAITKLLVAAIRNRWPEVKITLRADSGFCRWRLMVKHATPRERGIVIDVC